MRGRIILPLILLIGTVARADDSKAFDSRVVDRQLYESLKEIHNRGAELYNRGDMLGCQRLFEGSLEVARTALHYRHEEQKLIREGMAKAGKIESVGDRAFALHDLIEEVRKRLVMREAPTVVTMPKAEVKAPVEAVKPIEVIPVYPRESPKPSNLPFKDLGPKHPLNLDPKNAPKAEKEANGTEVLLVNNVPVRELKAPEPTLPIVATKPDEPIDLATSLTGQLFWKGEGLEGIKLMFVQREGATHHVFETVTGPEGRYALPKFQVGKYTVLLNPVPSPSRYQLPARYQTTTDSPLIYFLSPGEKHDFLLK